MNYKSKNQRLSTNKLWYKFKNNKALVWSIGIVLIWRSVLEIINQLLPRFTTTPIKGSFIDGLQRWALWDGGWYKGIVQNGYQFNHALSVQQSFAFFPLFPESVRLVYKITGINIFILGLLINLILVIIASYFIYKLSSVVCKKWGNKKTSINPHTVGTLSVLSVLLYPSGYFLGAYYGEAFLLVGVLGALYFTLTKRLVWAVVFIAIATATKTLGLVTIPTVLVIILEDWWVNKKSITMLIRNWLILLTGLVGLGAYSLYLKLSFGNALLFYQSEKAWNRSETGGSQFLSILIHRYYIHFFQEAYFGGLYSYVLNLIIMMAPFIILGVGIWIARRFKTFWPFTLGFFTLALPLSTGTMLSLNRYIIITIAPLSIFIFMSLTGRKRLVISSLYLLLSSVLLIWFSAHFLHGTFGG
jgi:Gpi18-like mannosyltransferase